MSTERTMIGELQEKNFELERILKKMVERIDQLENQRKSNNHATVGRNKTIFIEASTSSSVGDKKEHIDSVKIVSIMKKKETRSCYYYSKRGHIKSQC